MTDTQSLGEDGHDSGEAGSLRLRVVYSPDEAAVGRILDLEGTAVAGREVATGLRIDDARVSKLHFRVFSSEGGPSYADAGSSNGTFLNGIAVPRGRLGASDVLRVGDTLLVVEPVDDETPPSRTSKVARSGLPVLVQGETGTGKELVARRLHAESGRAGPFVPLNCATLPRDLASSELFGHSKGAFSGADIGRPGLFRAAEGGTLFLDEIGDLPLELQPALLRALEERKVRPIGAEREIAVDVRIVSATHVDLEAAVTEGRFRADLLGRIAHVVLRVPPLRARRWEVLALAREFAPQIRFTPNAAEALLLSSFPRNVRELRSLIDSVALLFPNRTEVHLSQLKDRLPNAAELLQNRKSAAPPAPENPARLAQRREELVRLLAKHQGNVTAVARELGKPRAQIYRWIEALGVDVEATRPKE